MGREPTTFCITFRWASLIRLISMLAIHADNGWLVHVAT
jgi:hypothetical protein